jgi:hypothetical protein
MDAAAGGGECHAAQVVGVSGEMDAAAMERFAAAAGLPGRGLSYAVVSILGPQGSGTFRQPPPLPTPSIPCSLPRSHLLTILVDGAGRARLPRSFVLVLVRGAEQQTRGRGRCVSRDGISVRSVSVISGDRRGEESRVLGAIAAILISISVTS